MCVDIFWCISPYNNMKWHKVKPSGLEASLQFSTLCCLEITPAFQRWWFDIQSEQISKLNFSFLRCNEGTYWPRCASQGALHSWAWSNRKLVGGTAAQSADFLPFLRQHFLHNFNVTSLWGNIKNFVLQLVLLLFLFCSCGGVFFKSKHTFVLLENHGTSMQTSVYLLVKRERLQES